jgi:glyoxylase-like metal-dependent hydrolase (beta-lactamase superfamily II)
VNWSGSDLGYTFTNEKRLYQLKSSYQNIRSDITCIETHYQREGLASCYLLQEGESAALIDTGTPYTVATIMALLEQRGLRPEQIRYVIPTHVHLDHAGGAGQLMQRLPEARLVVHPFGARHMIDPTRLAAGATAVYGEEQFAEDFGELVAVDPERVIKAEDGLTIDLNGRQLLCLDTPGHARHHICVWDRQSRGFFTGDTFGIAYQELTTARGPFMLLPSTPVQFDPVAWHTTLDRLMTFQPERMYLTHYCAIEHPETLVDSLHQAIDTYVEIAHACRTAEPRLPLLRQRLQELYLNQLRQHQCTLPAEEIERLLALDTELCAQGLDVWLSKAGTR